MTNAILFLPIVVPLIAALAALVVSKRFRFVQEAISLIATFANLCITILLFGRNLSLSLPWAGFGLQCSLRLYHFSAFIVLSAAAFGFLIMVYSVVFMRKKAALNQFYFYFLLTLSFASGVALADNLVLLLFFWEGLLVSLFGMISIGNKEAFKTATKAFIIVGISDLCMMVGIALTARLAGTLTISQINLPLGGLGSVAFILLMIGAISKAGSMPFHSWIPDAATDAPLPFMALVPAAFEKLTGIYFLTRISLDLFRLDPKSWLSMLLMIIGSVTILLAVMMALIQKEYKRLLSYHAISQVGYMILGIGTAVPAGIVGGLFHMINNALYKSGLFLTAGSVEKQTGTTNLDELGGIARRMPLTFICFAITAVSISGVPPFNGFFSKELVYDGALERGTIFYIAAVLGSFFTAASFLKLGHAAFLGKLKDRNKHVFEVSAVMLFPMFIIAAFCVAFGIFNRLPIHRFIEPILGEARLQGHEYSGFPTNMALVAITIAVLVAAFINHLFGFKRTASAVKAADHIHHAPVLSWIYAKAERKVFDPYTRGMDIATAFSRLGLWFDRATDWLYAVFAVKLAAGCSSLIRKAHNGNYSTYMLWSLVGLVLVVAFMMHSF